MEKIRVKLEPWAIKPVRAHKEDAGIDLYSPVNVEVSKSTPAVIDTGVHIEIPEGYVGFIKSKSGLNVKLGLTTEGVIDAGYTGSIIVKMYCNEGKRYMIEKGDKITQLVILPIVTPDIEVVDEISGGDRGDDGFGSTGR